MARIGSVDFQDRFVQRQKMQIEFRVKQLSAQSANNDKHALIIESTFDETDALTSKRFITNAETLAETHSIQRVMFTSEQDVLKAIQNKKYDTIWIRAHGTPRSISFSQKCTLRSDSPSKLMEMLAKRINKRSNIILESCATGSGMESVGSFIAKSLPGSTVYAPTMKISGLLGTTLNKSGGAKFNDFLSGKQLQITQVFNFSPTPQTAKRRA